MHSLFGLVNVMSFPTENAVHHDSQFTNLKQLNIVDREDCLLRFFILFDRTALTFIAGALFLLACFRQHLVPLTKPKCKTKQMTVTTRSQHLSTQRYHIFQDAKS